MSGTINFVIGHETFTPNIGRTAQAPSYIVPRGRLPISATRLCVWIWNAYTHIREVREVLALLARFTLYSEMLQSNPRFGYKFLAGNYLVRGFLNIRVCLMLYTPLQKAARAAFRPSTSSDPAR
jgi:hypothetical protein